MALGVTLIERCVKASPPRNGRVEELVDLILVFDIELLEIMGK